MRSAEVAAAFDKEARRNSHPCRVLIEAGEFRESVLVSVRDAGYKNAAIGEHDADGVGGRKV